MITNENKARLIVFEICTAPEHHRPVAGLSLKSASIRDWMGRRLGHSVPLQIKDLPVERIEEFADLFEAKSLRNFLEQSRRTA